jgi:hypothetical protein
MPDLHHKKGTATKQEIPTDREVSILDVNILQQAARKGDNYAQLRLGENFHQCIAIALLTKKEHLCRPLLRAWHWCTGGPDESC